jgi:hypothetical protein
MLYYLALYQIIFGYFKMAMIAFVVAMVLCLICGRSRNRSHSSLVNKMPYMNAVNGLMRKKYTDINEKNMNECAICMEEYKDDDEIAELKCSEKHYFHSKCLEEWLKNKLECPLCKKSVEA